MTLCTFVLVMILKNRWTPNAVRAVSFLVSCIANTEDVPVGKVTVTNWLFIVKERLLSRRKENNSVYQSKSQQEADATLKWNH